MRLPAPLRAVLMRLEYAGFRLVAAIARALPMSVASSASAAIWRVVAPLLRRHQRADRHLAASMPELSAEQRRAALMAMWEMLGRTFAEAFHLDRFRERPDLIGFAIAEDVLAVMRDPRGCVITSLHMDNWEIASTALMQLGLSPAGVYQQLKNPHVDAFVTGLRAPAYPAGLFSKGRDTVHALMRVLKQGGCVCIMADLRDARGEVVPFFGRPAPSTPFPALLARSLDKPLIAARIVRVDGQRFRGEAEIVPVPRTDDRRADITAATANLQAVFERWVRERPGHWMWAHRRWG